jgi:quinone-modifying oxidoreductase subunit QmoA
VNENCTCCGACADACQTEVSDEYNLGMCKTKAAYLPFEMAFPAKFVISPQIIGTDDAVRVKEACKYDAVDLEMQAKTVDLSVGALSGPPAGSPMMPTASTTWVLASTTTSSPT